MSEQLKKIENLQPMPKQGGEVSTITTAADGMMRLIERAIELPNLDMDRLQKLFEMKKEFDAIEAKKAFDTAMAAARAEIKPILKASSVSYDSDNPDVKTKKVDYKYANLADIAEQVDPILAKHGLNYRFEPREGDEQEFASRRIYVRCVITHALGHEWSSELYHAPDQTGKKTPLKAISSTITHLSRYLLTSGLGLSAYTQPDDDGTAADAAVFITDDQAEEIRVFAKDVGADIAQFCTYLKVPSIPEIPANRFEFAMNALYAKRGAA